MAEHNDLGHKGEHLARLYLEKKGYEILAENWMERKYELDLIAIDGNEIVFVEVKTRSTNFFENIEEVLPEKKQHHLIDGANCYLEKNEIDLESRFDFIAIELNSNKEVIKHYKSAFSPNF